MSTRKKWRLRFVPSFRYSNQLSMRKAYAEVERHRDLYAQGMSSTHHVDVEVTEDGRWVTYERIVFPERPPSHVTLGRGQDEH